MKRARILQFVFLIVLALGAAQAASAQGVAYGFSDIAWDSTSGRVTSLSATWLNYWAGLHYDPSVVGGMYMNQAPLGYAWSDGYADIIDAVVVLQTNFPSPPDTRFDVLSDHYIIAYFYTTVIILDDDYPYIPRPAKPAEGKGEPPGKGGKRTVKRYYDPMGFGGFGGGAYLGWNGFRGSSNAASLGWDYQYFYLGTTGKAIIANPTTCGGLTEKGEALPPCPTPTPTPTPAPLTVKITNTFRQGEDLSAGTDPYPALFGLGVQLNVETTGAPNGQLTYQWSGDIEPESSCATASVCLAKFAKPNDANKPFYTLNVAVKRGNETPVNKSVKVKVSLPTITYTGQGKTPRVTTAATPCIFPANLGQFMVLGCPDANLSPTNSGFATQAVVTAPAGLITEARSSWVEFRQLGKAQLNRWGPNNVREVFDFDQDEASVDYWLEDFNGRDQDLFDVFEDHGMLLRDRFANDTQQASVVTLAVTDSPSSRLLNVNDQNKQLTAFKRKDTFKTYVTYFTALEEEDFGNVNRHALAVIDWNWDAIASRSGNTWSLWGDKSPATNPSFTGTPLPFQQNSTKEIPFAGRMGNALAGILYGEFIGTSTPSPVTKKGKKNVAVFRPSTGDWHILMADGSVQSFHFGVSYDIPVPGDYDGDGIADAAVYRPDNPNTPQNECNGGGSGCVWYILRSSDGAWESHVFGIAEDKPAPGDFDGDGKTDIANFRPSTGEWWWIRSHDASWDLTVHGQSGDVPLPSDYDGDGFDDFAVWRPSTATWSIRRSSDQGTTNQQWGSSLDVPVVGDFDGDGKTDIANWQPGGIWHIRLSGNSQTVDTQWGTFPTDIPIPGDFDGDDKSDIAIWRSAIPAQWWILKSSDGTWVVYNFGNPDDVPVPSAFWP